MIKNMAPFLLVSNKKMSQKLPPDCQIWEMFLFLNFYSHSHYAQKGVCLLKLIVTSLVYYSLFM